MRPMSPGKPSTGIHRESGPAKVDLAKECRCGGQSHRDDVDGTKGDIPEPCALEECCCGPMFHEESRDIRQVSQSHQHKDVLWILPVPGDH